MAYTIYASICHHAIRTSSTLPWSGSQYDFDVRYCSDLCARGVQVRTERRAAESSYESSRSRHDRGSISGNAYRDTRRRYDSSRAAASDYEDAYRSRDDADRRSRGRPTLAEDGRRYAGLDDPGWAAFQREVNPRHGQRARVTESSSHRSESRYRDQPSYRRSSRQYEAGRYADTSGGGFYDTSNTPTRRASVSTRRPSVAPTRARSTSSHRSDAYLDEMSDNELYERRRQLERALSRYK